MKKITVIVLLAVVALAVVPLIIARGSEFGGADGQAKDAITQIDESYKPWFHSIWTPPSGEVEGLLFALQAAFGAGLLFYVLGYYVGRAKGREQGAVGVDPGSATLPASSGRSPIEQDDA